jgi:hypothetical protein
MRDRHLAHLDIIGRLATQEALPPMAAIPVIGYDKTKRK